MKPSLALAAAAVIGSALFAPSISVAFSSGTNCGTGYIEEITVGGWNNDRIYIKLSAGGVPASHTLWSSGWVRFSDQISGERAQAIRATALLALANDHQVGLHSNGNDCREATQIAIKPAVSGS